MGRTKKNIKLKNPEKPRKIKGSQSRRYRTATAISSRSRYDHFDTSPSFAYSLYQNPRERSRHLSRFWGENPCLGLLAVLPDSRDWRYNGTR